MFDLELIMYVVAHNYFSFQSIHTLCIGDVTLWPDLTIRSTVKFAALLRRTDQRSCPNFNSVRRGILKCFRGTKNAMASEDDGNLPFNPAEMVTLTLILVLALKH